MPRPIRLFPVAPPFSIFPLPFSLPVLSITYKRPICNAFVFKSLQTARGVYPPCKKTPKKKEETMNPEPNSTTSIVDPIPVAPAANVRRPTAPAHTAPAKDDSSRCQHRYENGTRCRTPGLPSQSGLCIRHFNLKVASGLPLVPEPSDFEDLSADLLPELSDFDAALRVNQFLSRLLVLVTKGRVTPRRAAVMAYITNQLLHSQRAIERELNVEEEIIRVEPGDMPRPHRDWPGQERQHSGPTVIWDVSGDASDFRRLDRSELYADDVNPTPAEGASPGHPSPNSGNGAPK
jgi:hypothetical protein